MTFFSVVLLSLTVNLGKGKVCDFGKTNGVLMFLQFICFPGCIHCQIIKREWWVKLVT